MSAIAFLSASLSEVKTQVAMTAGALTLARTCGRKHIVSELQRDLAERLNTRDSILRAMVIVDDAVRAADRNT